jgi:hypothetical protein
MSGYKKFKDKNPELVQFGKKWTQQEETIMLDGINQDQTYQTIAETLKRTPASISEHIIRISAKQILAGTHNLDQLAIQYKIPNIAIYKEQVLKQIESKTKNKKTKSAKSDPILQEIIKTNTLLAELIELVRSQKQN